MWTWADPQKGVKGSVEYILEHATLRILVGDIQEAEREQVRQSIYPKDTCMYNSVIIFFLSRIPKASSQDFTSCLISVSSDL